MTPLFFSLLGACSEPEEAPAPHDSSARSETGADSETASRDTSPDSHDTSPDTEDTVDTGEPEDTAPVPRECTDGDGVRWCTSCAELLSEQPSAPDGDVTLAAEGVPYAAYCDMTTAGGGWTLIGTNAWGGAWTPENIVDNTTFGDVSLSEDHKSVAFHRVPFTEILFETDEEYAIYTVGDGVLSYWQVQRPIPFENCGIDTIYEWEMDEGTLADDGLCSTNLYINVVDWEGGLVPCGDSESAWGPAWSAANKNMACPLSDPWGTSFISDDWDYNPWGDHDAAVPNLPLRMWVR